MAALIVQSRFAGLKIEDDDHPSSSGDGVKGKKAKLNSAKKPEAPKKAKNNNNKTQAVTKKKKPKQPATTSEQWESWKQKDEELADGNFEDDLHQAILLSKLDYEEKKDVYKLAEVEKKISDHNKSSDQAKHGKKKKKNIMSLEQFNTMMTGEELVSYHEDDKFRYESVRSPKTRDSEFFERVNEDAKKELLRDSYNDRLKFRQSISDDLMTRVQFADALEKKDKEIEQLKEEITQLKDELLKVKTRNKKLCHILGQGEMKDKAEVLVEVERLRQVQNELTTEMESLHSELQKERSRNADPRAKDKKKKGTNVDKEK